MSAASFSSDAVCVIAKRLLGEPNKHLSTGRELRFGKRGALAVIPTRGVFFDNESGKGGGVLDLVVFAGAARTRAEAARLLERDGNLPERETAAERAQRDADDAKRRTERIVAAGAIWKASGPFAGSDAERYLRAARMVRAELSGPSLRFRSDAPLFPYHPFGSGKVGAALGGSMPALVAAVTNAAGRFVGVHLTYLQPDGRGKAAIERPRKMAGTVKQAAVRLRPGRCIVVAEGLESTLSALDAAEALGGEGEDLGAAAGLSAVGVAGFEWPAGTEALIIAPDRDARGTGERAALDLAARAHASGLRVSFLRPPDGFGDWNAAVQAGWRP